VNMHEQNTTPDYHPPARMSSRVVTTPGQIGPLDAQDLAEREQFNVPAEARCEFRETLLSEGPFVQSPGTAGLSPNWW